MRLLTRSIRIFCVKNVWRYVRTCGWNAIENFLWKEEELRDDLYVLVGRFDLGIIWEKIAKVAWKKSVLPTLISMSKRELGKGKNQESKSILSWQHCNPLLILSNRLPRSPRLIRFNWCESNFDLIANFL